jgi:hypothetical protein
MSTIPVDNAENADVSAHEHNPQTIPVGHDQAHQSSTMSRSASLEGLAPRSSRLSASSQESIRSTRALPPSVRSQRSDEIATVSMQRRNSSGGGSAHSSNNAPVVTHESIREQADAVAVQVLQQLPAEALQVANAAESLLKGNFSHNAELRAVIEAGGNPGLFANWQLKTPREQQSAFARLLLDFANNNFENPTAMKLTSLFHMGAKGAFCVMLMTWARQLVANGLNDDKGFTDEMRAVTAGLVATLPPIVLLTAGGVKDYRDGTATTWSSVGRGALALAGAASLAVTAALGNLAEAGPALAAFGLAYCLGRDSSQLFIRTPGQMKDIQLKPTIASGVEYAGVEMGVGSAMSYWAPGTSMHADGMRGVFNGAGEWMDDINLTLAHLFKEGMDETPGNVLAKLAGGLSRVNNHYRNRLSLQAPTGKEVANMLLGAYPARAALFSIVVMAGTNFGVKTPHLSATEENNYGNLLTALILGTLYCAFAGMFAKRTPGSGRAQDPEAQRGAPDEFELRESPVTDFRLAQTPQRITPFIEEINVDAQGERAISIGARTDDAMPSGSVLATGVHSSTLSARPSGGALRRAPSQVSSESVDSASLGQPRSAVDDRGGANLAPSNATSS